MTKLSASHKALLEVEAAKVDLLVLRDMWDIPKSAVAALLDSRLDRVHAVLDAQVRRAERMHQRRSAVTLPLPGEELPPWLP